MAATRDDINRWLDELYANPDYTHMVVKMDWFDYDDYPVYVTRNEDVREVGRRVYESGVDKVVEVYSKRYTREHQMAEFRAFHYD